MDERNNLEYGARQSMALCPVSPHMLFVQEYAPDGISSQAAPKLHPQACDASPMLIPSSSGRGGM